MDFLNSISPIDGRYIKQTEILRDYFSEYAFIKYRIKVEIEWLKCILNLTTSITDQDIQVIDNIYNLFTLDKAKRVKEIELITNHDIKAIEYYIREELEKNGKKEFLSFVHFACTSEDINNVAYSLMIKDALNKVFIPEAEKLINDTRSKALLYKDIPMASHTHGQIATTTTVGKEFAVFVYRWNNILSLIKSAKITSKFSGAVGNFNSHKIAYPNFDWIKISRSFIENLGLSFNILTTQIESHDNISILFNYIKTFNNITYDFNSDMWLYINNNYFKQKVVSSETGSSIMPHKVNPINHENSMGNIKIGNSIFDSLTNNLQISRMQRDLSDSTMLRNIGSAFGYTLISISQSIIGINKLEINQEKLEKDLNDNPEILAEAIQTILRKNHNDKAYELLKDFSRGKKNTIEEFKDFINNLNLPSSDKEILLNLSPASYIGLAPNLCDYI